jgi:transcriptional regulator with XRE-family HTH domain
MNRDGGGRPVPDASQADQPARPPQRTLADKVNWLIEQAHPAGRGPYSNSEVATLIEKVTGEPVSHTTIWKLRNGQATNPQMRLIESLARTFGIPPAFFFDDFDESQAGLLQEQVELLAMVRDLGVTTAQLRALLGVTPEVRQAVTDLITITARAEAERSRPEHDHGEDHAAP